MEGNNLIWILLAVNAIGMPAIIIFFGFIWYSAKRNTEKIEEFEKRFLAIETRLREAEQLRHQDNEKFSGVVMSMNTTLARLDTTMQNLVDKVNFTRSNRGNG